MGHYRGPLCNFRKYVEFSNWPPDALQPIEKAVTSYLLVEWVARVGSFFILFLCICFVISF
jgi:hypothetical protein